MTPRQLALRAEEKEVLNYLRSVRGSTAWAMCGRLCMEREEVSRACQRLKRQGLVKADRAYWQAVQP